MSKGFFVQQVLILVLFLCSFSSLSYASKSHKKSRRESHAHVQEPRGFDVLKHFNISAKLQKIRECKDSLNREYKNYDDCKDFEKYKLVVFEKYKVVVKEEFSSLADAIRASYVWLNVDCYTVDREKISKGYSGELELLKKEYARQVTEWKIYLEKKSLYDKVKFDEATFQNNQERCQKTYYESWAQLRLARDLIYALRRIMKDLEKFKILDEPVILIDQLSLD